MNVDEPLGKTKRSLFRDFKTSLGDIRQAMNLCIRFPLVRRIVEDLVHENGFGICHEPVRFWWHRFGTLFAAKIRIHRVEGVRPGHWGA